MALLRLFLKPGIDKQNTEYGAEGGWVDCDFVRFRYGLPEKIGGWESFNNPQIYFVGSASEVFSWNALDGTPYLVIGTSRKVYVYYGGTWADITPIRTTDTVTFTTTNGSTTVVVNDASHGAVVGDFVTYNTVTGNPGGITNASLTGEFEIQEILSGSQYTILSPMPASSNASAAGSANAVYQINVGSDVSFFDYGWNTGSWNSFAWNTPRPASVLGLSLGSRVWQFDNYGQDLIMQLANGGIFQWSPDSGLTVRATPLVGAPTKSAFALLSTPDRHLVCFGTESVLGDPTSQDPMYVRYSDQEDIGDFVATATNTAGGQRLTDGNEIVAALRSRGQILIWTDTALHGQQYIGPPFTFGFQQLGANCGIIGPHACADVNGVAYWMSKDAFFVFDGTVKKIPSSVQDYVYKNLNLGQTSSVNVAINTQFNEVTWFYATLDSDFVNRSVTYNYLENVWSIGTMARTAWQDIGSFDRPLATKYDNEAPQESLTPINGLTPGRSILYNQETGVNDDGLPIAAHIYSGYFDIGDGDQVLFMKRFIPDFKNQVGDLTVRLLLRLYPQTTATPSSLDPYIITPSTDKVDTRARGRQSQLRIESSELDTNWRFGTMRVDIQPDGIR
jgi:hypothetical protein